MAEGPSTGGAPAPSEGGGEGAARAAGVFPYARADVPEDAPCMICNRAADNGAADPIFFCDFRMPDGSLCPNGYHHFCRHPGTLSSRSPGRTHPPSAATTRRPQRRPLTTATAACVGSLSTTVGVGVAPSAIRPRRAAIPELLALGGRAGAAAEAGAAAVALTDLRHYRRRRGFAPPPPLTTPAWMPPFRGPPCLSPLARGIHRP